MEEGTFQEFSQKLKRYKKTVGHAYVPPSWSTDSYLAHWAAYLREHWNKLPSKYKTVLKEIGFVYTKPEVYWFDQFFALKDFLQQHTLEDLKRNNKLYDWYYSQKADFKNKILHAYRKKLLFQIGVNFTPRKPTSEEAWIQAYKKLKAYKQKHGSCKVPSHIKEYRPLYDWICIQRGKDKRNQLSSEKKKLLTNIGFVWGNQIKKDRKDRWENRFNELLAYKKKHGTLVVSSVDPTYHNLRIWYDKLRQYEETLHPARRKKLMEAGFPFRSKSQKVKLEKWNSMYQRLRQYFRKHGHSKVNAHDKEDPQLANWVFYQRKNKDKLSKEQRKKLMQLKFVWDVQKELKKAYDRHWEEKFGQLQKFFHTHGHSKVTSSSPKIKGMVRWMITQRKNRYKLTGEQVRKLNSIRFEWEISREAFWKSLWDKHYHDLLGYYKKYGHSNVPIRYKENPSLGSWVNNVKKGKIKRITPNMLEQLKKVRFEWPEKIVTREDAWKSQYHQLLQFYKSNKHLNVPITYKGSSKLYYWLREQRRRNHLGKLKKEHLILLEKLGGKHF